MKNTNEKIIEEEFIRRNKDKFPIIKSIKHCSWCRKDNTPVYDVIGLAMCKDCISRITRLNKITGDIKVRIK